MFTIEMKERNEKEITLKDVNGYNLKVLVDFCYTGKLYLDELNVFEILATASRFEFVDVEMKCFHYLKKVLSVSTSINIWISVKHYLNFNELTRDAFKYATSYFLNVTESNEFLEMSPIDLILLLESNYLNVYSEEEVFSALAKWLNHNKNSTESYIYDLFSTIRVTQLKPKVSTILNQLIFSKLMVFYLQFLYEVVKPFCESYDSQDLFERIYRKQLLSERQPRPSTLPKIIIVDGSPDPDDDDQRLYVEVYSPLEDKWFVLNKLGFEKHNFGSLILGNELFIFGGSWYERRRPACNEVITILEPIVYLKS